MKNKLTRKPSPPETVVIHYKETLSDESEPEQEVMKAFKKWLPAFERQGLGINDLVFAMIHNGVRDSFNSYASGFLSAYKKP